MGKEEKRHISCQAHRLFTVIFIQPVFLRFRLLASFIFWCFGCRWVGMVVCLPWRQASQYDTTFRKDIKINLIKELIGLISLNERMRAKIRGRFNCSRFTLMINFSFLFGPLMLHGLNTYMVASYGLTLVCTTAQIQCVFIFCIWLTIRYRLFTAGSSLQFWLGDFSWIFSGIFIVR